MKSIFTFYVLITGVILFSSRHISAQEIPKYNFRKDILYRSDTEAQQDQYIGELCRLDVYYPAGSKNFTTIVWFHGGGITGGSKDIPKNLREKGLAVVSVNYRLNPKVNCPVYIEDAAAAVAWVFNHIGEFGGDTSKIVVSGHSAGGYLAGMVGLDKKWLGKYNIDANRIAMLVPLSGQMITHFVIRKERGISDKQPVVDEFAPLFHVRADASPLILVTGDRELEMLGRYEENAYMARMMKIAGHNQTKLFELDGFDHGGMVSPGCELLLKEIKTFTK